MGNRSLLESISDIFLYLFKYAWAIIALLLVVFIVIIVIASIIQKRRLIKRERQRHSSLLQMSYEDENKKSVAKRIDGETPENKKYCPLCHALTDKSLNVCSNCGYEFKEDSKEKVDY